MSTRVSRRSFLAVAGAAPLMRGDDSRTGLRLWYRRPAPDWNEALPIGAGRLGAMIFGGVAEERLQINENTLYSDEPGRRDLPLDTAPDFDRVIQMLRRGEYAEAAEIISRKWCGRAQPCYQALGDLRLFFEGHTSPSGYSRDLNIATAIATVRYTRDGVAFTREYFASFPDQALVIRLTASQPRAITFRAALSSVHPTARSRAESTDSIILAGQAPGFALRRTLEWVEQRQEQWKYPELWEKDGRRRPHAKPVLYGQEIGGLGMFFEARLRAIVKDGSTFADADGFHVREATDV